MSDNNLKAAVLAAGKGTRLQTRDSDLPKVMRTACGKPLLHYVVSAVDFISREDTIIVVGHMKETVISAFPGYVFAHQKQQLGTGHAVMAACEVLGDYRGDLLVCCGDMPLIKKQTYQDLYCYHLETDSDCTILSGSSDIDLPYGRIIRDKTGRFSHVVEDRDCGAEQRAVTELNSGVYVFKAPSLRRVLSQLQRDNAQGEYYLTDAPGLMMKKGMSIGVHRRKLGMEIIGVNTAEQLRQVEEILSQGAE